MVGWIAAAGGAGAAARYLLDGWVQARADRALPVGTFVINVSGSFLLGVLAGLVVAHGFSPDAKLIAGTGFLGGYTTFSTFAYETVRLAEDGSRRLALVNVAVSVTAGIVAAAAGLLVTGAL
jgi:CrcB protein